MTRYNWFQVCLLWLFSMYATIAQAGVVISERSLPGGCGKPLPQGQKPGNVYNMTITSGGVLRNYLVFIPPTYKSIFPTPIILSYHGGTQTSEDQLLLDQLTISEFNTEAFVVYPQGINNTWQGVPGVTTDDVQFTSDILDDIEQLYCLNQFQVFSTGKSDGGGFTHVLACDAKLSQRIAAFAPVSGAYYVDTLPCFPGNVTIPCASKRTDTPVLAFHGGNDTVIAYNGGERKNACLPSLPHFIQDFAKHDNLGPTNTTIDLSSDAKIYSYGNGFRQGLVELVYDSVIGHDWPSTVPNADNQEKGHHPASFNATPMILDFFYKHPLGIGSIL